MGILPKVSMRDFGNEGLPSFSLLWERAFRFWESCGSGFYGSSVLELSLEFCLAGEPEKWFFS